MTTKPQSTRPFHTTRKRLSNHSSQHSTTLRDALLMLCTALLSVGLTACAEQPSRSVQPALANAQTNRPAPRDASDAFPRKSVGPYRAQQITGDFAGYASLQQFVEQMVQKHGFEREYLMGVFSQAHRKTWTLDYLAKSDQGLKGKPAVGGWTRYRRKISG